MAIRSLNLKNFRAYKEARFDFCERVNAITGPNARGKTTLLEAIHLSTMGHSFRTPHLKEMIREGAGFFMLELTFIKYGVEQSLRVSYEGFERKIFHNDTLFPSSTGLLGLLPGTTITPDDISLIKGPPKGRRKFLDLQLAQSDPMYVHHLGRYYRAIRQRNQLLRSKHLASIETWEHELAKSAAYLVKQRYFAIEELQQLSRNTLAVLSSSNEEMALAYTSQCSFQEKDAVGFYIKLMEKTRRRDMQFGNTSVGPHRDDMSILLSGKEARHFASEGQQRSCVAALRLAEWQRLNRLSEEPPYFLVDDLGISFDASRRRQMLSLVHTLDQVFVTTSDAGYIDGLVGTRIDL